MHTLQDADLATPLNSCWPVIYHTIPEPLYPPKFFAFALVQIHTILNFQI